MFEKKKIKELTEYWITVSKKDLKDMQSLYKGKRYSGCLLFGHMILEKVLKALVVKTTKKHSPKIHNLLRLAELSKLKFSDEEWDILAEADTFNMEARYPDEKLEFYKKCTKTYADRFYKPITSLHKELCQKVNLKK